VRPKRVALPRLSFLGDAKVGAVDRHKAVVAYVIVEVAVKVYLRFFGNEGGSIAGGRVWR
jgi:hypothetical protein